MLSSVTWALIAFIVVIGFAVIVVRNTRREIARRRQIDHQRFDTEARRQVVREHFEKRRSERRKENLGG